MVKVSEFPEELRKKFLARTDMPTFDETPFVKGKPLSERRIALISTGGMHDRADTPFDETSADYRIISKSIDSNDLVMSHISTNYDRLGFQRDINVALPIDRMKELEIEGVIGSLADYHYSFMGATPPEKMEPYVKDMVKLFIKDAVDTVLLCPV
ncbi:MAG: selenoprotein B glycine/betaine/sarcosine/D-proline reductase [Rhodospirillales bacterium]|nr:selenoprotein B glycine/betaine/sarcosine/D-proline reductase [Rhodospirillales bacterium]